MEKGNKPMTETSVASWVEIKTTVAAGLPDALDVVRTKGLDIDLPVNAYYESMRERNVTDSAAQDILRFLEGTGLIGTTELGDIRMRADA